MTDDEITPGIQAKFDAMLNSILAAAGIKEGKNDIVAQCGSVRLRIFEAGEYVRKDTQETVRFDPGIELRQGGLVLHVEASDLAILAWKMSNEKLVREELTKRLEAEKQLMREIGF